MAINRVYPPSVQPGIPSLGRVPEGWTTTTFGQLLNVVSRPVVLKEDQVYNLVNAKRNRGGIVLREVLPGRSIKTSSQFQIRESDFLVSRRQIVHGACGVVPRALDGAIVSSEYAVFHPCDDISLDFLRYYSHSIYFQQTCFHASVGVTVEKLIFQLERWLKFPVSIPPLPEQKQIATLLSTWERAIELKEQKIVAKKQFKQSILKSLLTGEVRFPGFTDQYLVVPLGEVSKLLSGGTPSKSNPDYWSGSIPWITAKDLKAFFLKDSQDHITDEATQNGTRLIPAGTVLVLVRGMMLLKTVPIGITLKQMAFNQDIKAVLAEPLVDNVFLGYSLLHQEKRLMSYVTVAGHGTGRLPSELLLTLPLLLPPLDEQHKIAHLLSNLDREIDLLINRTRSLKKQMKGLMQQLLTGKVRVKVSDEFPGE